MDITRRFDPHACVGPTTGVQVLNRLHLHAPPQPDVPSTGLLDLLDVVVGANPEYLPGVAAGDVTAKRWYLRKAPQWVRVAYTPAGDPWPVGHVAVRLNGMRPDRVMLPDGLSWEVSMLFVRPGFRGCGIATELVHAADAGFTVPLWASVHEDRPGHHLLAKLGWVPGARFWWPDDPVPGLVMVAPRPGHVRDTT